MGLRARLRTPRVVLVVGLQKSGTTLLARLLDDVAGIPAAVPSEGDRLWGNVPPASPRRAPAGRIYAAHGGALGHLATAADATESARRLVRRRLVVAARGRPVVLNKNPYNTVRVPWLRALLPDAIIVAMVRRPVPNVYSLLKKHVPHDQRGPGPVDGWWGVQPPGWAGLVDDDKVRQCASQWQRVNELLADARHAVDHVVAYDDLCRDPRQHLAKILSLAGIDRDVEPPTLRSADDEHATGARLLSKNRHYRATGGFELPDDDAGAELPALEPSEIEAIDRTCASTVARFPELG